MSAAGDLPDRIERLRSAPRGAGYLPTIWLPAWFVLFPSGHGRFGFDPNMVLIFVMGLLVVFSILIFTYRHRLAERRRDVIQTLAMNHQMEAAVDRLFEWYWTPSWGPTLYSNTAVCGLLLAWAEERKNAGAPEDVLAIVRGARNLPGGGVPVDRLLLEEAQAYEGLGRRSEAMACLLLLRGEKVPLPIRAQAERLLQEIA